MSAWEQGVGGGRGLRVARGERKEVMARGERATLLSRVREVESKAVEAEGGWCFAYSEMRWDPGPERRLVADVGYGSEPAVLRAPRNVEDCVWGPLRPRLPLLPAEPLGLSMGSEWDAYDTAPPCQRERPGAP